jgi:peptide chain release factor 2
MSRFAGRAGVAAALLLTAAPLNALCLGSIVVSATPVQFLTYDPLAVAPRDATGTVTVGCSGIGDSGNRRHTSFASVFISPEVDDDIKVDLNPADIKMDVYRSSGAGGQHVNKTESAVRLTHGPTGIVVACQNERSQHKNRATAMKMLKAKMYELEFNKRNAAAKVLEDSKSDVSWGNQIRSYVLDQSRIKDLRTGVEIGDTNKVLDGNLDPFMEASLKAGL